LGSFLRKENLFALAFAAAAADLDRLSNRKNAMKKKKKIKKKKKKERGQDKGN
jgi:hypothetical protein